LVRLLLWACPLLLAGSIGLFFVLGSSAHEGSDSSSLRYVALGDSITRADYDRGGGYVPGIRDVLSVDAGRPVDAVNLGENGWTSGQLIEALRSDDRFRIEVARADVITVDIGTNDLLQSAYRYFTGWCGGKDDVTRCLRWAAPAFRLNLHMVLDEVAVLNPDAAVLLSDVYYPTTGKPTQQPTYGSFMAVLTDINRAIRDEADARCLPVAGIFEEFNGGDGRDDPMAKGLLGDGVHPSGAGFERITAAMAASLRNAGCVGEASVQESLSGR
jgi:lysophospholipase L1-like esterase